MGLTYADAVVHLFPKVTFTVREFGTLSGSPRPAKTLSELKRRGVVARLGRSTYRCLAPFERPDPRPAEWRRIHDTVLEGPGPKAWAGPTAVEVWTGGMYHLSPSLYEREFHLAVPRTRVSDWIRYLGSHRIPIHPRKRIGGRVVLSPRRGLRIVRIEGEPVVPRHEIELLIRAHPMLYSNASEYLVGRR